MPKEALPVPLRGRPSPPRHLDPQARRKYRQVVAFLDEAGYLSRIDGDLITQYAAIWFRWRQADDQIRLEGAVIRNSNGCVQINPWQNIWVQCQKDLTRLMTQMGLTPAARAKLGAVELEECDAAYSGF